MFPKTPLIATLCAGVLSYPAAILSERLVENPIRFRSRDQWTPALLMLAVCIAAPVLAWGGMRLQINAILKADSENNIAFRVIQAQDEYERLPCNGFETPLNPKPECRWGDEHAKQQVYLVGDSNARQWIPALKDIVSSERIALTATTLVSCPFVDLAMTSNGMSPRKCHEWFQDVVAAIIKTGPDVVIHSAAINRYIYGDSWVLFDADGISYVAPEAKAEAYLAALISLHQRLQEHGIQLLVVQPIPKFNPIDISELSWDRAANSRYLNTLTRRCAAFSFLFLAGQCVRSWETVRDQTLIHTMMDQAETAGVTVLRVDDALCPKDECQSFSHRPARVFYNDPSHLSRDGAYAAVSVFTEALDRVFDVAQHRR